MDDITSLQIRILSDQVTQAENRLKSLERAGSSVAGTMSKMDSSSGNLMGTLGKLTAAAGALYGMWRKLNGVITTTREWQIINSSIETVTGNSEDAREAWQALLDLAWELPFGIEKVSSSFIQMMNFGLTPSERAIRSFANTAASSGQDLTDFVNAVAKATVGSYEGLEKYGILARRQGDEVAVRFKGQTEMVRNSAAAIQEYFMQLGEKHFGGAVERRLELLDDAFEGLGESWKRLEFAIGQSGFADILNQKLRDITDVVWEVTEMVSSGQLREKIQAYAGDWIYAFSVIEEAVDGGAEAVKLFTDLASGFLEDHANDVRDGVIAPWDDVELKLKDVPIWFATMAKQVMATIDGLSAQIYAKTSGWFNYLVSASTAYHLKAADNPDTRWGDRFKPPSNAEHATGGSVISGKDLADQTWNSDMKAEEERQKLIGESWLATEKRITDNWNKVITEASDAIVARESRLADAQKLRDEYDARAEERAKARRDRLEKYGTASDDIFGSKTGKGQKGGSRSAKDSEFDRLVESLKSEEQALRDSYAKRLQIIYENTTAGSEYQAALSMALQEQYAEDAIRLHERKRDEYDTLAEFYAAERDLLRDHYEQQRRIIVSSTALTEEEKLAALAKAQGKYMESLKRNQEATVGVYLDNAQTFFRDLAYIGDAFGRTGFKVAQAAAIANATVDMYRGAVKAYADGGAYAGPIMAAAALAAGAANIAAIKAQSYSGAYEHGGLIPSGSYGLVGEAGPEYVRGPAVVTSARTTADRNERPSQPAQLTVNVTNNAPGVEVATVQTSPDGKTLEIIIEKVMAGVARQINSGRGSIPSALENTYPLQRGRTP